MADLSEESGFIGSPILLTQPSERTLRGLDWLNFFLADVQSSVGPFLVIYLMSQGWDQQRVGFALAIGVTAGIVAQTPAGILVDRVRSKRKWIVVAVFGLLVGAVLIAWSPSFWSVAIAQVMIGGISCLFLPSVCAISLGVVGHERFASRQGRNQTCNSIGNVVAAALLGVIGYFISERAIFLCAFVFAIPTLYSLHFIHPDEICHERARGEMGEEGLACSRSPGEHFRGRSLVIFLICAVLFHFANAAMLPLLGEVLTQGKGRASMIFMSACVMTPQLVIALLASWVGRKAKEWGRKPLLTVAFGILPVRGVLYTLTHRAELLIAIQILDGVCAAIFGVVSVLVIADLTRGTGRFNLTLGVIATAVGIGAALSQIAAGTIAHHFGYRLGFLFLAAIASGGFILFCFFMPETNLPPAQGVRSP